MNDFEVSQCGEFGVKDCIVNTLFVFVKDFVSDFLKFEWNIKEQ